MFNCIIMGAAGRDFHDFKTFFRDHPEFFAQLKLCIIEFHPLMIDEETLETCRETLRDAGLSLVEKADQTEAWIRPR